MKQKLLTRIKGLQDELDYCRYKVGSHPSPHWQTRIEEIDDELKSLNMKVKALKRKKKP